MTSDTTTPLSSKISILSELWINYRDDENFDDFIAYNDIGLPIAYALDAEIVKPTSISEKFIDETFDLLLSALDIEDTGYETLDDLLDTSYQG